MIHSFARRVRVLIGCLVFAISSAAVAENTDSAIVRDSAHKTGGGLYTNPPLPIQGTLPVLSSFFKYRASPLNINANVESLFAGSDDVALQVLDALYTKAQYSFKRSLISDILYDKGVGGGCRSLKIDSSILYCSYSQQSRVYMQNNATPEALRKVYTRGICQAIFLFKYSDEMSGSEPVKIEGWVGCDAVKTDQPQVENGIPVQGD